MDAEAVGVEGSRCAVHPERAGTACSRCGTFGCPDCLVTNDGTPRCRDCLARSRAALPSLARRARWARASLLAAGIAELALVPLTQDPGPVQGLLEALGLVLGGLVQLATPFVFLAWYLLAARHALAAGRYLEVSAWRAVGTWFIPFVNLVQPFDLVRRMSPTTEVAAWQLLFIVGNLASRATRTSGLPLAFLAGALVLGAALTGAKVVADVTRDLEPRG